ncbi:DUF2272 domain-containing protein [Pantoea sp. At-9b]|jgi:hypothetical protein|uniref:DUF2272 domain-containing protein n=1 Tax=Pantoea sp. (strain At-9b) TaxID=592316 RepID=UPI0001B40462|nr:DUF2272 domain-containing protein [Pantoea sp. At-9b]ADU69796.1 Protein of unknown function DUF2272 [Pantoea sp. At-9b]
MSEFIASLLSICKDEYAIFHFGQLKESDNAVYNRVGDYWKSIPVYDIDGRTTLIDKKGHPYNPAWSAAFISFIIRTAGAGETFKYAQAHCHYIEFSRKAKKNNIPSAYYAVAPDSAVPSVGDIICSGREYATNYSFEQAELAYKADGHYPSHGDIVVDVNREHGYVLTIGGNVSNSVNQKKLPLSDAGILLDRVDGKNFLPWLALLQCNL